MKIAALVKDSVDNFRGEERARRAGLICSRDAGYQSIGMQTGGAYETAEEFRCELTSFTELSFPDQREGGSNEGREYMLPNT
jgi:hypothetical protein